MTKRAKVRQGNLDYLCGLYCCFEIIRQSKCLGRTGPNRDRKGWFKLVEATQACGLFDAKHFAGTEGGYKQDELVKIFNTLPERFTRGLRARPLDDFVDAQTFRPSELKPIFEQGGYAIIDTEGGCHWLLAKRLNSSGKLVCFDPASGANNREISRPHSSSGVAFISSRAC